MTQAALKRKGCYMVDELLEAQRLATRLRRVRLERGLSLRGAAALIGVTKETLSDLERARRQPHPPTLAKIADGYGVKISDLLGPMVEERQAEEEPVYSGKAEAPSDSEFPEKTAKVASARVVELSGTMGATAGFEGELKVGFDMLFNTLVEVLRSE